MSGLFLISDIVFNYTCIKKSLKPKNQVTIKLTLLQSNKSNELPIMSHDTKDYVTGY